MKLLKPLIAIVLCLNIPLVALAHPGRTDSSGGHTDHSTGEYHYHHGEPAHQHTDKDGDGILECPYRINGSLDTTNKTTHSVAIRNDDDKKESESSKKIKIPTWVIAVLVCAGLWSIGFIVDAVKDITSRRNKK